MMSIAIALVIGFFVWYAYIWLEDALNGGTLGRNPWLMPFQLFYESLLWYLPGGMRRRGEYIKEVVGTSGMGHIGGDRRSWSYEEIRKDNLYEECAKDALPGPVYFWLSNLVTFFGPLLGLLVWRWFQ